MPVEFGAVDTGKIDLAADVHAAAAAHAGAVDHHRVEAGDRLDAGRLGGLGAELHHDRRADGIDTADRLLGVLFQEFLERLGDQGLAAGRAVVGGHDVLIADRGQPVGPKKKFLGSGPLDGDYPAARLVEGPGDGINGRGPHPAGDHHHGRHVLDFRGLAQRADECVEPLSDVQARELQRTGAHDHQHQSDGSLGAVKIGDGQRDPLAGLVGHHHDELAGLRLSGNAGRGDHDFQEFGRQVDFP
jgi:hypothetical protein